MSVCSIIRQIRLVIPTITGFLIDPSTLTPAAINQLVISIELIEGSIRELPIPNLQKLAILNQLDQAIALLQTPGVTLVQLQIVADILAGVVIDFIGCDCC